MELTSGTLLEGGKYRIISTLGQGGFGITYLAEQVMTRRMVCIKEFFPKDYNKRDEGTDSISILSQGHVESMARFKDKFIKEAQTIASFDHHHVIHIHDLFEENNTAYYVMEYIEGMSLNEIVKQRGALSESVALKYIKEVASALSHVHNQKINHLDIKPGNIMVRSKDDSAILIDFGLSKHYDDSGDQTSSTPVGISHGYAPIEQYKSGGVSSFSPSTDIYSLGATFYYLVTGSVPPSATDIGRDGVELPNANISDGVRRAIISAMSYWREERPQSIEEFVAILDDIAVAAPGSNCENTIIEGAIEELDEATIAEEEQAPQYKEEVVEIPTPTSTPKSNTNRTWLWILLLAVIIIGGITHYKYGKTEIYYTTLDREGYKNDDSLIDYFDAQIVSHTYMDGHGVIKFFGDVTEIYNCAFEYHSKLSTITIPEGVTKIGERAFYGCSALTSVDIPDSVTEIGDAAFYGCNRLDSDTKRKIKDINPNAI